MGAASVISFSVL